MGLGKSWILGARVVPLINLQQRQGSGGRCESSTADPAGDPMGLPAACCQPCGRVPSPCSLWGWGTFLLKASAQKRGTRPSLSSHHQASPPHALGWAARGPSTRTGSFMQVDCQLSSSTSVWVNRPSHCTLPGCQQSRPDCVLACSFQRGNGHSLPQPEWKAHWELHCAGWLSLAEEGTFRMDPSSEQKPENEEGDVSWVTEERPQRGVGHSLCNSKWGEMTSLGRWGRKRRVRPSFLGLSKETQPGGFREITNNSL